MSIRKSKGWHDQPNRHALASKGIKTRLIKKHIIDGLRDAHDRVAKGKATQSIAGSDEQSFYVVDSKTKYPDPDKNWVLGKRDSHFKNEILLLQPDEDTGIEINSWVIHPDSVSFFHQGRKVAEIPKSDLSRGFLTKLRELEIKDYDKFKERWEELDDYKDIIYKNKSKGKSKVDVGDEYYHVRQRNPDKYDKVRVPDWAKNVAQSISKNAQVKMGKRKDTDEWDVQAVMIERKYRSKDDAVRLAKKIKRKIEEE